MDCTTIGFAGFGGGHLAEMVDECIVVESYKYGPVEDIHLVLEHVISYCIVEELASEGVLISGGVGNKIAAAD
jgi:hypothetical protein